MLFAEQFPAATKDGIQKICAVIGNEPDGNTQLLGQLLRSHIAQKQVTLRAKHSPRQKQFITQNAILQLFCQILAR